MGFDFKNKEYLIPRKGASKVRTLKRCIYCDTIIQDTDILTKEHLIPRSRGGANNNINVKAACKPCNEKRGDMPLAKFIKEPGLTEFQRKRIQVLIAYTLKNQNRMVRRFDLERRLQGIESRWTY